jgi:L-ascorbate metabolism protein UlaG (beta-lactamase superfamily)
MLFRRAEGLRYRLRACERRGLVVEVPHRGRETLVPRDEALLLGRLATWHTPDELGAPESLLYSLCDRDLAYFFSSEDRPRHVLGAQPLLRREGKVALRRNLRIAPLIGARGAVSELPFMPRVGSLDGAELAGLQLGVVEHDEVVAVAHLHCCARHAQSARALVPRLDGRHTWQELAEGAAEDVLDLLDLAGLVEAWSPPSLPRAPAQVTWLGHAGLLYEAGGARLVVDPMFPAPSLPPHRPPPPGSDEPFDPRRLGPVDGVLVTHGDNDHLNPEALLRFDTTTPLYLPSSAQKMAWQVDLEGVARLLGFIHIQLLDEWQAARVAEVTITAAPFVGEDWGLALPKRTYLLSHPSLTVFLAADSAFMPEVYSHLAQMGTIDLACLGVAGCAEPHASGRDFGYGHFYLEWIPPERRNEWLSLTCTPEESARAAALLSARRAFGYAAGASFLPMSYSDRGSHAELAALLAGTAVEPIALPLGTPVYLQT